MCVLIGGGLAAHNEVKIVKLIINNGRSTRQSYRLLDEKRKYSSCHPSLPFWHLHAGWQKSTLSAEEARSGPVSRGHGPQDVKDQVRPEMRPTVGSASRSNAAGLKSRSDGPAQPPHRSTMVTSTLFPLTAIQI